MSYMDEDFEIAEAVLLSLASSKLNRLYQFRFFFDMAEVLSAVKTNYGFKLVNYFKVL